MKLNMIQDRLDELHEFAAEHYPQGDRRPDLLRKYGDAAFNSADDKEIRERLRYLQSFIRGGINRFTDVQLKASDSSELTDGELNEKLHSLTESLYTLIDEMLSK